MTFLADDEMAEFDAAMSFVNEITVNGVVTSGRMLPFKQETGWVLRLPSLSRCSSASLRQNGVHVVSSASNRDNHHTSVDEDDSPRSTEPETPKGTSKKRKTWVSGDSNRARNERRIHVAYLRKKVAQLETELEGLQQKSVSSKLIEQDYSAAGHEVPSSVAEQSVWKPLAQQQRRRREKAEIENARLKLVLEGQRKSAKSMQMLLLKRAKSQQLECSRIMTGDSKDFATGRLVNYHSNVDDFEDMLIILEGAYRQTDEVFCMNGLNLMELTHNDKQIRKGYDGIYLDVFSNKVLPFELDTTAKVVWDHFKGADKHGGKVYNKTAKVLEASDTILESFAKEMNLGSTHAMFRVQQVLRRYVEKDRVAVVFISIKTPLEEVDEPFASLTHRHQCYAVVKRSSVLPSQSVGSRCLLQMCSLVSLERGLKQRGKDSPVMDTMTKFMMGDAGNSIAASQDLIVNALMDQAVNQPR